MEVSAEKALEVLKGISDEEIEMLGMSTQYARPEWMIITGDLMKVISNYRNNNV